jgi:hypothetical protein
MRRVRAIELTFPNSRVELERSQSGKGFHLILWLNPKDHVIKDFEDSLKIRKLLSDDPTRIRIDRQRHAFNVETNVLFTEKIGRPSQAELIYDSGEKKRR